LETVVLKVDPLEPEPDVIRRTAEVLRAGGLVAFPTETVYGLGANALDSAAVARIFEAKGRPATNPVILHVSDIAEVLNVAAIWPETAGNLANRFWPGPLTLVVPKSDRVPGIVTAGGTTVAVRCPNHPVAQALIREAGVPIAAPSANRSTELSPTRAEHVLKSLNGRIDLLLDGGPCSGGLESTVVDVTGEVPHLLRPGLITVPMLESVCGRVEIGAKNEGVSRSPGQMAKHYSPRVPLYLVANEGEGFAVLERTFINDVRVYWMNLGTTTCYIPALVVLRMPDDPTAYSAIMYEQFHMAEEADYQLIVTMPPDTPEWAAVRDRLTRAAAK
jgi:L-threonylcarbamoyladenylate synthase